MATALRGNFEAIRPDQVIQLAQRQGDFVRVAFFLPNGGSGIVYCGQQGQYQAATWNATREKALQQICRWRLGRFQIEVISFDMVPDKRWHGALPPECHKIEVDKISADSAAVKVAVTTDQADISLNEEQWRLLTLVNNRNCYRQLRAASKLSPLGFRYGLETLMDHGILTFDQKPRKIEAYGIMITRLNDLIDARWAGKLADYCRRVNGEALKKSSPLVCMRDGIGFEPEVKYLTNRRAVIREHFGCVRRTLNAMFGVQAQELLQMAFNNDEFDLRPFLFFLY